MLFNPYKTSSVITWLKAHVPSRNLNVIGFFFAVIQVYCFFWVIPPFLKDHWPTQFIQAFPRRYFLLVLTIIGHTTWAVVLNLIICVVYKLNHPFFEQYKNTTTPWPWDTNPELWRQTLRKTLKVLAFNHFVIFPIDMFMKFVVLARKDYMMDVEDFPTGFTILKHILFCIIMEDFITYWVHRLLHRPYFYARVHKMHHDYTEPVMLASEYAHWFEYIISNLLPAAGGLIFLQGRLHLITHMMWMSVRMIKSGEAHSGYDFPWSPFQYLPFGTSEAFHDFHHTNNIGNYSSFLTIWDTLMGTTVQLPETQKSPKFPLGNKVKKVKKIKS